MVVKLKRGKIVLYACSICHFKYPTIKLAKQCEAYCKKHKSCSLEITKHAIK